MTNIFNNIFINEKNNKKKKENKEIEEYFEALIFL